MIDKAITVGKHLTSKETARLLGVSEASVKRWADSGVLATAKTAGGHRRFRPEDVAVFRRVGLQRTGRPAARTKAKQDGPVPEWRWTENRSEAVNLLYEVLVGGQAEDAAALLIRLYLDGVGVATLADEVLCPAMRRIGDLWHQGDLSVAQEHVATRAALQALIALRVSLHPRETHVKRAICCATEQDFHELPVQIAALTLESRGWEVVNLGPSTPFYALSEAITRFRPQLVCVASTILEGLDRAAREYGEMRKVAQSAGALIVLGGAGFEGVAVRRRFPAEINAESFQQLEAFAVSLSKDGRDGNESS